MSQPPLNDPEQDPRPRPSDGAQAVDSGGLLRPAVASTRPLGGAGLIIGGAVLLGLVTFVILSTHRGGKSPDRVADAAPTSVIAPPPPPPADLNTAENAARAPVYSPPAQATLISPPTAPPPTPSTSTTTSTPGFAIDKAALARKSPALVVDLAEPAAAPPATKTVASAASTPGVGANAASSLSGEEQFSQRVSAAEPERSRATLLGNAKATIPQGAMIPGVLETALDSDLPGFARAVVSRDVRGFDGSTVLIQRGSRVIGQYKSALAQGQSRVFVIWTRIIRPDGATIQIGSPVTDPLGRGGLDGKVDRHFFERFGGAILLSVLNAGVASLATAPSTQVVIGSSAEATNLGSQAVQPTTISPTIKVPQGAAIRIFVARDLDFSSVGGG